jgi:hypothetical protein
MSAKKRTRKSDARERVGAASPRRGEVRRGEVRRGEGLVRHHSPDTMNGHLISTPISKIWTGSTPAGLGKKDQRV